VPLGEDFTLAFDDEWNFQVRATLGGVRESVTKCHKGQGGD